MRALVPFTLFMAKAALVFASPWPLNFIFAALAFAWLTVTFCSVWSIKNDL
jgi:hypothetical protein